MDLSVSSEIFQYLIFPALLAIWEGLKRLLKKRRIDSFFKRNINEATITKELDRLREVYGCDRVVFYGLHNGIVTANGRHWDKVSVFDESFDARHFKPIKPEQQNVPLSVLSEFLLTYKKKEIFKCPDREEEERPSIKLHLEMLNIRSTYSKMVYDDNGDPAAVIVINYYHFQRTITDFSHLDNATNRIGMLITP